MSMALSNMHVNFPIHEGTLLASRYEVQAFLGEGGFGKVAKCLDVVTNMKVAVKITKDEPLLTEYALEEIKILKQLQTADSDKHHLVRWDGSFLHQRFICLQFELLDVSLRDYMQQRHFQPLSMGEICPVLHQLTTALVHLEDLQIVHADLKPENIMIVDRRQRLLQVKLIDFGLACHVSDVVPGRCVQTLWYRAPEVMLGMHYSEPIDMWSLGAVAAELAVGFPVFPGDHEYDMMKFIVDTLGQPPDFQLKHGKRSTHFFNIQGSLNDQTWRLKTPEEFFRCTGHHFKRTRCFHFLDALNKIVSFTDKADRNKLQHFVDLLKKMLQVDKFGRIIPLKVLEHPFFSVDQHTDTSPNMNIEHLTVTMETSNVTQQPSSDKESNISETISFHGETVIAGPENLSIKLEEEEEVVEDTSKNTVGCVTIFFQSIKKAFSCWP